MVVGRGRGGVVGQGTFQLFGLVMTEVDEENIWNISDNKYF